MSIIPCCERMKEHLEAGDIRIDSSGQVIVDFDSFLFGSVIHYCPFCGEKIRTEER